MKNTKEKIQDKYINSLLLEKITYFINLNNSSFRYASKDYEKTLRKGYINACDEIRSKRNDLHDEINLFKEVTQNSKRMESYLSGLSEDTLKSLGLKNDGSGRYKEDISKIFIVLFSNKLGPNDLLSTMLGFRYNKETRGRINTIHRIYCELEGFSDHVINHHSELVFATKIYERDFKIDNQNQDAAKNLRFIQNKFEFPDKIYKQVLRYAKLSSKEFIIKKFNPLTDFIIYSNTIVEHNTLYNVKCKVIDLFDLHKKIDDFSDYEKNIKKLLDVFNLSYLQNEIIRASKEMFVSYNKADERIHENLFKYITPDDEYAEVVSNNFLKKNISIRYMLNHLDFAINRKVAVTDASVGYRFINMLQEGFKKNLDNILSQDGKDIEFLDTDGKILFNLIVPEGDKVKKIEEFFKIINQTIDDLFDDYQDRVVNKKNITNEEFFEDYFNSTIQFFKLSEKIDKNMTPSSSSGTIKKVNKV